MQLDLLTAFKEWKKFELVEIVLNCIDVRIQRWPLLKWKVPLIVWLRFFMAMYFCMQHVQPSDLLAAQKCIA